MRKWLGVVGAVALCGCAGRTPAPVQVVQMQDRYMDCAAIFAEVASNNAKVQQLASDQGLKTTQNIAAGVVGFVFPPLWFGMDFQGAADKETAALQSRQQYLATLAEQRRCGAPEEPPPQVVAAPAPRPRAKKPAPVAAPAAEAVPAPQ